MELLELVFIIFICVLVYTHVINQYIYIYTLVCYIACLVDGGHQLTYHTAVATNKVRIMAYHHAYILTPRLY